VPVTGSFRYFLPDTCDSKAQFVEMLQEYFRRSDELLQKLKKELSDEKEI